MIRTTMLAIVAVLALQSHGSLAGHLTEQQVIDAFNAQKARIDALEAENAAQQSQIDELFDLIESLHPPDKLVFVTSQRYIPSIDFVGLAGADGLCQQVANGANLPGLYKAWMSDTNASVDDRLVHNTIPLARTDGIRIALDWSDLTDGFLDAPIDRDEFGAEVTSDTGVWTGTLFDGSATTLDCTDWTDDSPFAEEGSYGNAKSTDGDWTDFAQFPCAFTGRRLYCFEQ